MDRISCVIVDNDERSREALEGCCRSIPYVDVVGSYHSSERFVEALPSQKFDVCLLDLDLSRINGLKVVGQLDGQSVIFVTAATHMLEDALKLSPVDIVLKPLERGRFNDAMAKAYHLLNAQRKVHRNGKECEMLNVDGVRGKIKFRLADIMYVHSDKDDPRHKYVITRDGNTQRVMDCKFERLVAVAHNLVRLNCSEAVSLELVKSYEHDYVIIEEPAANGKTREVALARTFRKEFKNRIEVW